MTLWALAKVFRNATGRQSIEEVVIGTDTIELTEEAQEWMAGGEAYEAYSMPVTLSPSIKNALKGVCDG